MKKRSNLVRMWCIACLILVNMSVIQCAYLPKLPGQKTPTPETPPQEQLIIRIPIGSPTIYVNGGEITTTPAFINDKGNAMIPLRLISDIIAAKSEWIPNTKEIVIEKEGKTIQLQVKRNYAIINNLTVDLASPPEIHNERVFVPLSFIGQEFGFMTDWIAESKTITLIKNR
jgi:hypothetical protein